jgi:gliding motility-associated-like protein
MLRYSLLIFFCAYNICIAQKQNNNWCFGKNGGISFATGVTTFTSAVLAKEHCAAASDRTTGNLLFYTDGVKVWNRNHTVMPNGTGIGTDVQGTSVQGTAIARSLADTCKYYIFTVEPNSGNSKARGLLNYSILDMTLDNGLGDIVAGQKAVPVYDSFSEAMTLVPGNCCIWVVLHRRWNDSFYAYKLQASGLQTTPVKSVGGYGAKYNGVGTIKVSPDHKKLALVNIQSPAPVGSFVAIHDFNVNTGVVSNGMMIDTYGGNFFAAYFYGCEFSPNSSKLFATQSNNLYQYDLSSGNAAVIKASRVAVNAGNISNSSGLQLGPDSNIYSPGLTKNILTSITNPNQMFPGCIYSLMFPTTPNPVSSNAYMGLPQPVALVHCPDSLTKPPVITPKPPPDSMTKTQTGVNFPKDTVAVVPDTNAQAGPIGPLNPDNPPKQEPDPDPVPTEPEDTAANEVCILDLPNAFSPNRDGINDVLLLKGTKPAELMFRIFNRWGQTVFESRDMSVGWDGAYKGVEQPVEGYAYVVRGVYRNGTVISKKGSVFLMR